MISFDHKTITLIASMSIFLYVTAPAFCNPEQQEQPRPADELPYKYVGHNESHKFHRPSCPFARVMSVKHLELFHFRKEAVQAGYMPCRYCLPPWWKSCHVRIVPKAD